MRDLVIADKSEIVNIADAVRSLTGSTTTMNLSGMKSHLNTTKTSIDNAFAAIANKGVTVPDGSTSDALAEAINSIETGEAAALSLWESMQHIFPVPSLKFSILLRLIRQGRRSGPHIMQVCPSS